VTYHLVQRPRRSVRRAVGDDGAYAVATLPPPMPPLVPFGQTPTTLATTDSRAAVAKILIGVVVVIALLWLVNEMTRRSKISRNPSRNKPSTGQLAAMLHERLVKRGASPAVLRSLASYAKQR